METTPEPRRPLTQIAHHHLREVVQAWRGSQPTGTPLRAIDATAGNGHDTLFLAGILGPQGEVAAFDIQPQALENTSARLLAHRQSDPHRQSAPLPSGGSCHQPHADATPGAQQESSLPTQHEDPHSASGSAGSPNPHSQDNLSAHHPYAVLPTDGALAAVQLFLASHAHMAEHLPQSWRGAVCAITFNLGYLPGGDKSRATLAKSTLPALNAALQLLGHGGLLSVLCYRGHSEGAAETAAIRDWLASLPKAFEHNFTDAAAEAPPHAPILLHVRHRKA